MLDRELVPVTIPEPDDDAWPAQAGWYFDPSISARRWWDGDEWTDLVETRVPVSAAGRHSSEPGRHGVGVRIPPLGRHGSLPEPQLVTGRRMLVAAGAAAAAALVFGVVVPALRTSPQPQAAPGGTTSTAPSATAPSSSRPSGSASRSSTSKPSATSATPTLQGGTGGTSSDSSLLVDTSGSGDSVLPEFATLGAWQLEYTYDCGGVGGSHPFRITSPDGAVVSTKGTSGADSVDRTAQGIVKLTVTTPCAWTVQVFGPAATP